ncbi:MAG TPA: hypothetical protein VMW41_05555 [Candidatus Bathyarchaeia archaeon]|nr:hypothetical protein [Candidatus Bathyarchaeia archaeon]
MGKLLKKIFLIALFLSLFFSNSRQSWAISQAECVDRVGKESLNGQELQECEQIFNELIGKQEVQAKSLESQVIAFDQKIALAAKNIIQTENEIKVLEREVADLGEKVKLLDLSLDRISALLVKRIEQTYKKGRFDSFLLLFSSDRFSRFASRFEYFRAIQLHDKKLLFQMESARLSYEQQKKLKEEKQQQLEEVKVKLEEQKVRLAGQKADKERFLAETRGNKAHYEQLLQVTRAEIEAIVKIVAGEGECGEAGPVNEGERIAAIIAGASACSLGTHLHFEVREGDQVRNPFVYLKSITLIDASDGDPHAATGSWQWPLNEPIKLTQGFGENTSAIRSHVVWYPVHTGIDINAEDLTVKAVKKGLLYRCSIDCGGGTLRYVKVDHEDSDFNSYYLHVNY